MLQLPGKKHKDLLIRKCRYRANTWQESQGPRTGTVPNNRYQTIFTWQETQGPLICKYQYRIAVTWPGTYVGSADTQQRKRSAVTWQETRFR
jgi:hypothetical protein